MRNVCLSSLSVCAVATLLGGCVPGYNSMIFATKTNAALVVETKTPEVSLDIGRVEGVLAPSYEGSKTLHVLSSFRWDSDRGFLSNRIGSTFSTGDAAVAMSRLYNEGDPAGLKQANELPGPGKNPGDKWYDLERRYDSGVELYLGPPKFPWFVPPEEPGKVRPVLFGTDTSFGFKMAWQNPETAATGMPDYLRLGFQRRELAFAAINIGPDDKEARDFVKNPANEGKTFKPRWLVARAPSLLATVDANLQAAEFLNSGFSYIQYFASGGAATALAMRQGVRKAMWERLDPAQAREIGRYSVKLNSSPEAVAFQDRVAAWTSIATIVDKASLPDDEQKALYDGVVDRKKSLGEPSATVTQGELNRERLRAWLKSRGKWSKPGDESLWLAESPEDETPIAAEELDIP